MLSVMGMMDRDYYQEHWAEKVLGIKPKPKPASKPQAAAHPFPPERGPIYVSGTGTASRSIDADPRLHAVYRQRQQNAATWRRIWLRIGALIAGVALGALLWRLRR